MSILFGVAPFLSLRIHTERIATKVVLYKCLSYATFGFQNAASSSQAVASSMLFLFSGSLSTLASSALSTLRFCLMITQAASMMPQIAV